MKSIILLAISSGLLFGIINAADPTVTFTANPNSFKVGTPFNVKCHVENVDLKNVTVLTVFYMINAKDPANSDNLVPYSLGAWTYAQAGSK